MQGVLTSLFSDPREKCTDILGLNGNIIGSQKPKRNASEQPRLRTASGPETGLLSMSTLRILTALQLAPT